MNPLARLIPVVFLLYCPARAAAAPAASMQPSIDFHSCVIQAAHGLRSEKARCGTLVVPENRAEPDGRQIELFVAILPALAANAEPDPLFFIAGGPGMSAVDGFLNKPGAFAPIRKHRDIVLVDQRGTGRSNPLDCPHQELAAGNVGPTQTAQLKRAVRECLQQLEADPRHYTTSVALRDLDAVRRALGANRINLYGISYGTRVALEYLRYYGDHVRTVILDGVAPTDLALGPQVSVNAMRALKRIFERCAESDPCAREFPDPVAQLLVLGERLEEKPATLTIADPLTGAPVTVTMTRAELAGGIRLLTYATETSSLLPLLIHAGANGYLAPLAGLVSMINSQLAQSVSQGMNLSVVCTEDVPFYEPDVFRRASTRHTWAGAKTLGQLRTACSVWPNGVIRPDFKEPVVSDTPVLLLSGENDPITPPANAAHAAETLSNSLSIVVDGQGHGVAFRGCLPRVMAAFVAAGSVDNLDTDCVERTRPAPFFLRFSGPAP